MVVPEGEFIQHLAASSWYEIRVDCKFIRQEGALLGVFFALDLFVKVIDEIPFDVRSDLLLKLSNLTFIIFCEQNANSLGFTVHS